MWKNSGEERMKLRDFKIDGKDVYELETGDIVKQLKQAKKHSLIIWDESKLKIDQRFVQEQIDFLQAMKKWRSWDKMSSFAQQNVENQINELKYTKERLNANNR